MFKINFEFSLKEAVKCLPLTDVLYTKAEVDTVTSFTSTLLLASDVLLVMTCFFR